MKEDKPLAKGDVRRDITPGDSVRDAVGSHPVGTGVGAVGGMAAGAAIGTAAGPVGTLAGAAVGAIAGALAGSGIAEMVDPVAEDAYWRDNYASRPYVGTGASYDDYAPAYRYGMDSYARYGRERNWDEIEAQVGTGWNDARGNSRLAWDDARHAARDSWHRVKDTVERATPGDSDHDGK
jgi:hypothetical protein